MEGLKTGPRRVRLIHGWPYLNEHLRDHPTPDDPEAPLFYSRTAQGKLRRYSGQALGVMVKRIAVRAGITRGVYPHLFRHTAATNAVRRGIVGAPLRIMMGWADNTDMEATYIHLSQEDADHAWLKGFGVKLEDDREVRLDSPIICPTCGVNNVRTAIYCHAPACGAPLTAAAELEAESRRKRMESDLLEGMLQDPMAMELLARRLAARAKSPGG